MHIEQCTDVQLKKIYEEFNATEETVRRDVKTLMEWLEKQPHLPNVRGQWVSESYSISNFDFRFSRMYDTRTWADSLI